MYTWCTTLRALADTALRDLQLREMLAPPSPRGPAGGRTGERRASTTVGSDGLDNFAAGNYSECHGPANKYSIHPLKGVSEMGLYALFVTFMDAVDRVVDRSARTRVHPIHTHTHTHTLSMRAHAPVHPRTHARVPARLWTECVCV